MFYLPKMCAFVLMCRWLDIGQDDGLIERQIDVVYYVQTPPPQEPIQDKPGLLPKYL